MIVGELAIYQSMYYSREENEKREPKTRRRGRRRTCHAPSPTTPTIINIENNLTLSFVLSIHQRRTTYRIFGEVCFEEYEADGECRRSKDRRDSPFVSRILISLLCKYPNSSTISLVTASNFLISTSRIDRDSWFAIALFVSFLFYCSLFQYMFMKNERSRI